jgi:Icc-related predicted phosphoesterase
MQSKPIKETIQHKLVLVTQRLVLMSDTHSRYGQFDVPEGDILLIAGDLTFQADVLELQKFNDWLDDQDFEHKIIIPGNHDLLFEKDWDLACTLVPAADAILNQEMYWANDLKIWGEPRQPEFFDWAFNVPRDRMKKDCWDKIPTYEKLDVLLTHGPPWGVCDVNNEGVHVGCAAQRDWILKHQPRVVVCGHIHPGYGLGMLGNTLIVNASVCNKWYEPLNPPVVLDLNVLE